VARDDFEVVSAPDDPSETRLSSHDATDRVEPEVVDARDEGRLQEQLGLKLKSFRGRVPVIIIERAKLPTPD
jgi:uncharacterized protein (TIGR03435 family)